MTTRLPLLGLSALGAALLSTPLFAATCQYEEEAPAGAIVAAVLPEGVKYGSLSWRWIPDDLRTSVGQTFSSVSDFTLERITIFTPGASPSQVDRPFTIVIEEFDNEKPDSPRTVIATESAALPPLNIGGKYTSLTLETPIQIHAATTYGFRLEFDSAMPTASFAIRTIPGVIDKHFAYTLREEANGEHLVPTQQNLQFWLEGNQN